jgi:hypothetical protein
LLGTARGGILKMNKKKIQADFEFMLVTGACI